MKNTHAAKMDAMYRRQRYIYDLSRKYFLFGRDTLLARLPVRPGMRVVEIGCGTARNLVILASRHPQAQFYGADISSEMLLSARANIRRRRLENVVVATAAAEGFDHRAVFGLDTPFDIAFFSYSLSMIPDWRAAVAAALASLRPGGWLGVVDFWDQKELPRWFEKLLGAWVRRFDVTPRPEILDELAARRDRGEGNLTIEAVGGRYAFIALFETALPSAAHAS
ncbi:MAG: class I SAM-dependent methyltransferase [Chloracidobacterium sp.]|nr:class I SAM-dependent methyltransferase [Chloracidobacterium sp.]MDW8216878.1 class I SAM-dependent methyltransferase [Acidobacteriota bacterium]